MYGVPLSSLSPLADRSQALLMLMSTIPAPLRSLCCISHHHEAEPLQAARGSP